jgi:peptidoglycan hydrolase CwlO-like protein|tara:strand:- start:429 stop:812 length:384 start_codon:yes stop_codon:yes gene_type:complete
MSFKERLLYLAIAFFGVYYLINMYSSNEKEYINEYNNKIEALEQKVDSLHHVNGELTFKIDTLNTQIVKLDQKIDLKDNKIQTLKWKVNEKVNAVDSFNDDELTRFFTERYGQYLDSIKKTNSKVSN